MSEHEQLPDPMPDDPRERERVRELLGEMYHLDDVQEAEVRAKAEAERIHQAIMDGRSPNEILDELGDVEGARRVIGDYYTEDLLKEARDEAHGSPDTITNELERETWLQILELKNSGATDAEILVRFSGLDELERRIGTNAARSFMQTSEQHKEEQ